MWRIDAVYGVRYRDPRDPDQLVIEFDENADLGPLRRALTAELQNGARTLEQLRRHALLETVYRPPHAT
jgi:hypothetical protein